jgi:hypothetical protein
MEAALSPTTATDATDETEAAFAATSTDDDCARAASGLKAHATATATQTDTTFMAFSATGRGVGRSFVLVTVLPLYRTEGPRFGLLS